MATAYIGIGSNLGNREKNLEISLGLIREKAGAIITESEVIESEPWGFEADTHFLNMVARLVTDLNPRALLASLMEIETEMGRKRSSKGYQSRIIDLDILLYDDLVIETGDLIIPHPQLHRRLFVLEPLSEIDPGLMHPVFKKTVSDLITLLK